MSLACKAFAQSITWCIHCHPLSLSLSDLPWALSPSTSGSPSLQHLASRWYPGSPSGLLNRRFSSHWSISWIFLNIEEVCQLFIGICTSKSLRSFLFSKSLVTFMLLLFYITSYDNFLLVTCNWKLLLCFYCPYTIYTSTIAASCYQDNNNCFINCKKNYSLFSTRMSTPKRMGFFLTYRYHFYILVVYFSPFGNRIMQTQLFGWHLIDTSTILSLKLLFAAYSWFGRQSYGSNWVSICTIWG